MAAPIRTMRALTVAVTAMTVRIVDERPGLAPQLQRHHLRGAGIDEGAHGQRLPDGHALLRRRRPEGGREHADARKHRQHEAGALERAGEREGRPRHAGDRRMAAAGTGGVSRGPVCRRAAARSMPTRRRARSPSARRAPRGGRARRGAVRVSWPRRGPPPLRRDRPSRRRHRGSRRGRHRRSSGASAAGAR